ncbi:MAG: hypothetical protein LBJ61_07775 [Deltaproteobacteria bacterium]|jgi:MraZ protein|nr:hypothetical protein [Deltaproteobacteria bacterium]
MANVTFTFKGRQTHTVDDKGRLILPSQFRTVLAASREPSTVYLGSYPGTKFVSVYPSERWDELCRDWKDEKRFPNTEAMQDGQRLFFANIEQTPVDRTGRVTIPAHFRERANLKDDVLVIGVAEKMEIWNPAELEAHELALSREREERVKAAQAAAAAAAAAIAASGQMPEEVRLPSF